MRWSAKVGRFAGIDVYVHATFPLLLVWVAFVYWAQTGTLEGVMFGIALILVLFVCVVLHEYGHALTARRYGIGTRHITLLPIGGVASLERMPKEPSQEIVVALAGPAVNVVIALAVWLLLAVTGLPGGLIEFGIVQTNFLQSVLFANILLAVFNMIPAFPMDGGRVLRAVLSMRMDRVRATRTAATIGQTLAVGFGILGLFANPFLILIAVFIWIGAAAEASQTEVDARLQNQPVRRAMITDFQTLERNDPLARAIDLTLAGTQKDFPVVDGSRVVGVVRQSALLRGLRDLGTEGRIAEVMEPAPIADISTTLADLLTDLQDEEVRVICITNQGRLVGIVDIDNIAEFLRIQAALAER